MKKEIATLWVQALRSGDYTQGTQRLRDPKTNSFCCLGVLCNLHAQAHPELASTLQNPGSYLGETAYLPPQVTHWAGMRSTLGRFQTSGKSLGISLAFLNDSGTPFSEIADLIEKDFADL